MEKHNELLDYLDEFVKEFKAQLGSDFERWGDEWKRRSRDGQELRTFDRYLSYVNQFVKSGVPVPWLKIVGNAYICWLREKHPELCDNLPFDNTCIIHVNYDLGNPDTYRSVDVVSGNRTIRSYSNGPSPIADYNDAAHYAHDTFPVVLISVSVEEYINDRGDVELRRFPNFNGSRMIKKSGEKF
jgi:hypothetical protein